MSVWKYSRVFITDNACISQVLSWIYFQFSEFHFIFLISETKTWTWNKNNTIAFIIGNVKEIYLALKRKKIFDFLKKYARPNRFIFLQETHSSKYDIKKWEDHFKTLFGCGKTKSCGVLIWFYGTKKVELIRKISHNLGRILLVEVKIKEVGFVLINIYKANIEPT